MRAMLAGILAIGLLVPFACHAQMYKCVDERGRIQFRDVPCKGMVNSKPPASAPGKEGSKPSARSSATRQGRAGKNPADAEARRQKEQASARKKSERKLHRYEREEANSKAQADAAKRCVALRNEYLDLSRGAQSGLPGYSPGKDRAKQLALLRDDMRSCP